MKKYTANYAYTNPNFVIQNLQESSARNNHLLPILYVLKNILQRGFPATLSKNLQKELGEIHNLKDFKERFLFATKKTPVWHNTIKGDKTQNYFPAKDFFERIVPNEFGEYSFVQSLIIPEIKISDIAGEENQEFINQQVDFYLPQAKLVIEIDGQQHKNNEVARVSDKKRDDYLLGLGIKTIRIDTKELRDGSYKLKVKEIVEHLSISDKLLSFYKKASEKIETNQLTDIEISTKLLPTAIIRFQILLIELLANDYLSLNDEWNFNILSREEVGNYNYPDLAIKDLLIWLENLFRLKNKSEMEKPVININYTTEPKAFAPRAKAINIDFSLFKRYTDENILNPDIIYVRTDYFDLIKDKNYFRVSTAEPINYKITDEDKSILEFFLENIFDKEEFREGQFPIISNALNRNDTIGLLPTGGGKSICYQLPCLLQPSINFVVCPIKSLMYDQKENLERMFVTNVGWITSDLDAKEKAQIETNFEQGRYLFVWISPERLQILSFRERITSIINNFSIAYAVVDEVHCLSEWGHDFRTSYLNLTKTVDKLSPKDEKGDGTIKFIGLTATASVNVLKDIKVEFSRRKQSLEDDNIKSLLDYSRKELQFEVINDKGNKSQEITSLLNKLHNDEGFLETDLKAGLVFTPNVNGDYGCYPVSNTLNILYKNKVSWFSGEVPNTPNIPKVPKVPIMPKDKFNKFKLQVQKDFKKDKYQILVATKAFGMGIDKQNIFYTFHYGLPSSVEALYQEAGRAGRWDKKKLGNESKVGKCYVLYSPETCDKNKVEQLFRKDTTFSEMKTINSEVGWGGKDIFRQVFLFTMGQNDVDEDFKIMLKIIQEYFREDTKVKIFWKDAHSKIRINDDVLQKAIYKLSLLGIVSDWTTDFKDYFEVQFKTQNDESLINSISDYILKYEPDTDVKTEVSNVSKSSTLEKSIWYLLNWTFENIAYNRKQSLKTLSDWCSQFEDSESFKKRIDNYFIFSEVTFVLQHIAEHPKEYEKWFEVLLLNNEFPNENDFKKLRDSISRFLESYRNNLGLNFLSGFVRLALNDYEDSDGRERFESSIKAIKETFTKEQQERFIQRIIALGQHCNENQKIELCRSISEFYPEKLEILADYYNLPYLLNDVYVQKLSQLKKFNTQLYEQLAKI